MQAQLLILGCLLARACLERPEFFGYRLAWDETGQQLTLFLNGGTTESGTWQVMVMRLHMVILWGASEWYEMTIVLPPIVIPSTSAANMRKGLFCHPMTTKVWTGIAYLLGRAIFSCILAESDAASANLKLGAFLTAVAKNHHSSHFLHWLCSLHQAQLSEISMVAAAGKSIKMVARLYSLTLLLKGASMMASMFIFAHFDGVKLRGNVAYSSWAGSCRLRRLCTRALQLHFGALHAFCCLPGREKASSLD